MSVGVAFAGQSYGIHVIMHNTGKGSRPVFSWPSAVIFEAIAKTNGHTTLQTVNLWHSCL